jgi:hypothetical protein
MADTNVYLAAYTHNRYHMAQSWILFVLINSVEQIPPLQVDSRSASQEILRFSTLNLTALLTSVHKWTP